MMETVLSGLLIFPFVILIILLIIAKKIRIKKSKRLGWAVDVTTPFLAIAVVIFIRSIWDLWFIFYMGSAFCVVAIIVATFERFKTKEFRMLLVLRKTWRVFFLLLVGMYILLIIIGIILQIMR